MTELLVPFRGERYAAAERLSALIAPPYDVITPPERAKLAARDPHNIVHLTLPEAGVLRAGGAVERYAHAAALLDQWRQEGALARDPQPGVYVLAQDFALPTGERRTRLGMFAALSAEPYETGRVKPHERTHAGPKADRLALRRATRTGLEAVFVLAPDPDGALAAALTDVAQRAPVATAELDGVRIRLWVVTGDAAARLTARGSVLPLYMADGHHRYETAVAYARENPAADRLLAFVGSAKDPGLAVLATHRVIYAAGRDPAKLVDAWRRWFDVAHLEAGADPLARLAELARRGTACVVAWPGEYEVELVLRERAPLAGLPEIGKSEAARTLDVAVVEALVVQAIVRAGTATPTVTYTPDPAAALTAVRRGGAAAAVLLNPTRVEQVLAVADAGDFMPPKSTYFAPKVPAGLVLLPSERAY